MISIQWHSKRFSSLMILIKIILINYNHIQTMIKLHILLKRTRTNYLKMTKKFEN